MKCFLTVVLVFLVATSAFSQVSIFGETKSGLNYNISGASSEFPLDGGEADVLEIRPMPGVAYQFNLLGLDMGLGFWIPVDIDVKNGDGANWKVGLAVGFIGYKNAIIGLKWDALREHPRFIALLEE